MGDVHCSHRGSHIASRVHCQLYHGDPPRLARSLLLHTLSQAHFTTLSYFCYCCWGFVVVVVFKDFIYLFVRGRIQAGGLTEGEREAGSPLSREPDTGLDPRTPDHDLSRKQTLNQPSAPLLLFLSKSSGK